MVGTGLMTTFKKALVEAWEFFLLLYFQIKFHTEGDFKEKTR